jgi:hypothetical protein
MSKNDAQRRVSTGRHHQKIFETARYERRRRDNVGQQQVGKGMRNAEIQRKT